MQFLKKFFFGLVWSIGIFFMVAFIAAIVLAPSSVSEDNVQTFEEGYESGYKQGHEFGQKYSSILLLLPLAVGFGGAFMGILPGTRKKTETTDDNSYFRRN